MDTSLELRIFVAQNEPIDPVALHVTLKNTIDIAREKAALNKETTYLLAADDPFKSDVQHFPNCMVELESKSKVRNSRFRLKYGRVVKVLQALRLFLDEGGRWHNSVVIIKDLGLRGPNKVIGRGRVIDPFRSGFGPSGSGEVQTS